MAHYTSIGIQRSQIEEHLQDLSNAGICNIMALRGDLPQDCPDYTAPQDGFSYANELIGYIRQSKFDFSIGGACYPEKHIEAVSPEEDLSNLKKKVEAGAEFLITQLFFINEHYFNFVEKCRAVGIDIPIIPGIMPITNYRQIDRFTSMAGCQIPQDLIGELAKYSDSKENLHKISYEYSLQQCQELLQKKSPGIHFYTLNQSSMTKKIFTEMVR